MSDVIRIPWTTIGKPFKMIFNNIIKPSGISKDEKKQKATHNNKFEFINKNTDQVQESAIESPNLQSTHNNNKHNG